MGRHVPVHLNGFFLNTINDVQASEPALRGFLGPGCVGHSIQALCWKSQSRTAVIS